MGKLTPEKYRELFKLRAEGKLDDMECTKSLYKILEPLYFDGIKILDIPCGVGHYFRKIRELGNIDYLGIDFDSKAIKMAKEIWKDASNTRFNVQNVSDLDLEDNSMDIVYCYNLLLHLKDYKKALRELFRVSKRYLIVRSLFDEEENTSSVDVAKDYLKVYPSGKIHYNTYARNDIAKFLKSLGLCRFRFVKDNLLVPKESIEKQEKLLKVDSSEFTKGRWNKKQELKGLELNYEVLFIEKEHCFIIAEVGVNHNGDIITAKKLIDEAKEAGVDAVKFQTFKAENIVTPDAKQAKYQIKNIGKKESQYAMLKKLELSYSVFRELKKYCDKKKIIFLSTPHSSKEDVDLISKLCPAIKVGSGDLTNSPILEYMAKKQLPIILSTGMATLKEVKEAVKVILPINKKLILLHCTTNYPTPFKEVNLKAMLTMEKEFQLPIGYSDHTEGINISLAAVSLGACVIEKHFTLDKNLPGPDHKASLEPKELKEMVKGIRKIEKRIQGGENQEKIIAELNISEAMGDGIKKPNLSELEVAKVARKSIVAAQDIKKGIKIKESMLAVKRPGTGIKPKYLDKIIGNIAKKDIKKDELISWTKV